MPSWLKLERCADCGGVNLSWPSGAPRSVSGRLMGDLTKLPSRRSMLGESGDGETGMLLCWFSGEGMPSSIDERGRGSSRC